MEEQGKGVRVSNCPLGWDVCHPFCYWRKGNRCYYTSKRGGRIIKLKKEMGELWLGKLPKLSIAIIKADTRYFCEQGFVPRETLSQVEGWLEGADDPEIQAKVIKWLESDIKWTQEIWAEVAHYYWYLWPVVWFVSHHLVGRAKRWVEILKKGN